MEFRWNNKRRLISSFLCYNYSGDSMYNIKRLIEENMKMGERTIYAKYDIKNPDNGSILVRAGGKISNNILTKLLACGCEYIDVTFSIDDPRSQLENNEFFKSNVKPTISREKVYASNKSINKALKQLRLSKLNIDELVDNSKKIVTDLMVSTALAYDLGDYFEKSAIIDRFNEVSEHSTRVAVFASCVARELGFTRDQIEQVTTAAMLHDFDIMFENEKIFENINFDRSYDEAISYQVSDNSIFSCCNPGNNPDTSTSMGRIMALRKEYNIILLSQLKESYNSKFGPYYTYQKLQDGRDLNQNDVNSNIKRMVLYSREDQKENGPLKISEKKMSQDDSLGSQIINMCSVYDEELRRNIRENDSLENVYAAISSLSLDKRVLEAFMKAIPLYPLGTIVRLSTGELAVVSENFTNGNDSYQPKVLTQDGIEYDLRIESTVTIQKVYGYEVAINELEDLGVVEVKKHGMM